MSPHTTVATVVLPANYGSGEAQLDLERLHAYRRLAAIHGETELGMRYLNRASEVAERLRAYESRL